MKTPAWKAFQHTLPQQTSNLPIDRIRENLVALDMMNTIGAFIISPGWNSTNSFVRGLTNPGTAAAPTSYYWYRGSGVDKQWIKQEMDYSGGASFTRMAFYYSNTNEAIYNPMYDADGNYVFTINYDSDGVLAFTVWGSDFSAYQLIAEDGASLFLLENGTDHIALEG